MSPKKHNYYPPEFKSEALKLVEHNSGNIKKTATSLGIPPQTLYTWVVQSTQAQSKDQNDGLSDLSSLQNEIKHLKKALKTAEMERDILKKATAYFAKISQ